VSCVEWEAGDYCSSIFIILLCADRKNYAFVYFRPLIFRIK